MNELATQQIHLYQSSFQASYCPNIFSRDNNNFLEYHLVEKFSRLVKMQIEEPDCELASFGSFLRLNFRFQKSKGLQPSLFKLPTTPFILGYG